jgi:hypothetical protein
LVAIEIYFSFGSPILGITPLEPSLAYALNMLNDSGVDEELNGISPV